MLKKKFILPVALSSAMLAGSIPVSSVFAQPADSKVASSVQASKVWNEKASVPLFVKERLNLHEAFHPQNGNLTQHVWSFHER